MTISGALSNALTGLVASSRAADVVSSNLANVLTEGFAPRRLELAAQGQGRGGVRIAGVTRQVDATLLGERRMADSRLAHAETRSDFVAALETILGPPGEARSLSARIAALDASLISASGRPEARERLQEVALRAGELAGALNAASDQIQARRTRADGEIGEAVGTINRLLSQIRDINRQIAGPAVQGRTASALEDQRQGLVDRLAEFIPVRAVPREQGAVALYTPGGAVLLDGTAATLEFDAANVVAPHMRIDNGLLSGLRINGAAIDTSESSGPVAGGRLAALFAIRDDLAVDAQTQLDAVARDLIERFQAPGLDPTRAAGDPGLFTDAGAQFDPADEIGVAGRLMLNAAVDPDRGGALWRLRDGLNAAAPGPEGHADLLGQLQSALSAARSLASGDLGATARSAAGHQASLAGRTGQQRLAAEQEVSFAASVQTELVARELEAGVDSDAEMQRLMLIEQSYAANARLIEVVGNLMDRLLRI